MCYKKVNKTAPSALKPQSEKIQENIQDLNSEKVQGSKALTFTAIAIKRQIRLYVMKKEHCSRCMVKGELLKITYTAPKNGESSKE